MPLVTIYRDVYRIGGRDLTYIYDSNVYLIRFSNDDYVLIDVGTGQGLINLLNNMLELGASPHNIRYVIVTHAHYHAAGALWWFSRINALTIAHEPDSSFIRKGDRKYTSADDFNTTFTPTSISINIGYNVSEYEIVLNTDIIKIFHTPGHTKGSISVLIRKNQDSMLFVGDSLSGILSNKWLSNENEFKDTVRRIHKLVNDYSVKILCTSIECYRGNNIGEFIKYVMNKEPLWV